MPPPVPDPSLVGRFGIDPERLLRLLVLAAVLEHVLFVIAPLNVLAPVDPHAVGQAILHGRVPYRDFLFEYPPLALIPFVLTGVVPKVLAMPLLGLIATGCDLAVVAMFRDHRTVVVRYLAASLFVFPFLSGGFDGLVVVTLAASTVLLARRHPGGWWIAGLGAATKLVPGVAWVWARSRPATAVVALVCTGLVLAAPLAIGDRADDTYIGFSVHRGVQEESLGASLRYVYGEITGHPAHFQRSDRYRSTEETEGTAAAAGVMIVAVALLAAVAIVAFRGRDPWLLAFAAVLIITVGSKVLSPQFVAYASPLAAWIGGRLFRGYLIAAAVTIGVYVYGSAAAAHWMIAGRNVVLAGVAVAASWAVVRRPRAIVR